MASATRNWGRSAVGYFTLRTRHCLSAAHRVFSPRRAVTASPRKRHNAAQNLDQSSLPQRCPRHCPQYRDASAWQARGHTGIAAQPLIEVRNGLVVAAHPEIDEAAQMECLRVVGSQSQRLIAIGERGFSRRSSNYGNCPCPATIVEGAGEIGLQTNRLVEVLDRTVVVALVPVRVAAVIEVNR